MTSATIILSSVFALAGIDAVSDSTKAHHEVVLELKSSIRALDVVDENTIIFSGYGGMVGISKDSGTTWDTTRVEFEGRMPAFRACDSYQENIFFASIESPGLIFRAPIDDLGSRELIYRNNNPSVFLDAMAFTEDGMGIVMGDPQHECLTIIRSHALESNWEEISCNNLPSAIKGEAAFAASNGNISIVGENVWIATGGKASRVFYSADSGETWEVFKTPLIQGDQMTGAFAISFRDGNTGIAVGGNWDDKENNKGNIAISRDSGKSWELISEGTGPGYRSSIIWHPADLVTCVVIGSEGIDISYDEGNNWHRLSNEGYYTGRFTPDGKTIWLAGHGRIGKIELK